MGTYLQSITQYWANQDLRNQATLRSSLMDNYAGLYFPNSPARALKSAEHRNRIKTRRELNSVCPDRLGIILNIQCDGVTFYAMFTPSSFMDQYINKADIPDPFAWDEIIKLAEDNKFEANQLPSDIVKQLWDLIEEALEP